MDQIIGQNIVKISKLVRADCLVSMSTWSSTVVLWVSIVCVLTHRPVPIPSLPLSPISLPVNILPYHNKTKNAKNKSLKKIHTLNSNIVNSAC